MTAKLNIHIDRGVMPRSGILNKKFDLLLDDRALGALGWGEKRSFTIPAGDHKLLLNYRHYNVYYKLDIHAEEGGTVDIDSVMNPKKGGFTLFNQTDGRTSDRNGTGSSNTPEELIISRRTASEELVVGACASGGAILFVVLNIVSGGHIPGGFIGGVLGGGLGALAGMGINALRRGK